MTEEVKKILNNFIKIVKKPTYTKETYDGNLATLFKTYTLETSEVETLLNYITNLQKENEKLKQQLDFIDEQNKYIDKIEKMIKDYKSSNEKAIEYIKNTTLYGLRCGKTLLTNYLNDLLNILKGGDE